LRRGRGGRVKRWGGCDVGGGEGLSLVVVVELYNGFSSCEETRRGHMEKILTGQNYTGQGKIVGQN
jgi:hypothetical protein